MVQNGGRPRRLSNGITVQNGLQKGQSQPSSSRNSLVVNNGHLHPGYLPKRLSSPRLTVPVNGKSSERRYIMLVIMIRYSAGNIVGPQIRTDTDLGTLIGNIQCGNFCVFMPLKNLREIDRPLVDTFRMYLCADTDTFSQNVSVRIQIQYQKTYLCADTDTFSNPF